MKAFSDETKTINHRKSRPIKMPEPFNWKGNYAREEFKTSKIVV